MLDKEKVLSGNQFNKYESQNIIVKYLMNNFLQSIRDFVGYCNPKNIHELGCGEGYLLNIIRNSGYKISGSDYCDEIIKKACEIANEKNLDSTVFSVKNIYEIGSELKEFDLILCSEVFEHLHYPEKVMEKLSSNTSKYLILSVPNEPLWRILNLTRLTYIKDFGNTPGHINHWSKSNFLNFVSKYFKIIDSKSPLPWTIVLLKKY